MRRFTLLLAVFAILSAAAQLRVACVGNSITYGATLSDRATHSYPAVLQRLLGDDYEVGNFGHNGATLLRRGHNPYYLLPEFAQALEFNPDIVVIHLGINDTDSRNWPNYGDEFVSDYLWLIQQFREQNPEARMILARLTPITAYHKRFKTGTQLWRQLIQAEIEKVAESAGCELIDFEAPLLDRQNLLPDAVHPNAEGAALLANAVYQGITGDYGGLQLPIHFTDGIVLQRHKPIVVHGLANAGDEVMVKLANQLAGKTANYLVGKTANTVAVAVANERGEWAVRLPAMEAASGLTLQVSSGGKEIILNDVAVGEVWVASGQSNMAFTLEQCVDADQAMAQAEDSLLRFFNMKPKYFAYNTEMDSIARAGINAMDYFYPTQWQHSAAKTAAPMSAVAYFFGKALRDSLDVPIGIIANPLGGAPIEAWIDIETLQEGMADALVNWQTNDYVMPWVQERAKKNVGDAKTQRHPYEPSYLYGAGMRPLEGTPIAGIIWYQGESNAHNVELHEQYFGLLAQSFRRAFGNAELPIIYAQLSSIDRSSWPAFRDSQRRIMDRIPNAYMAVTHDWGDSLDVHPRNKRPVGERMARWALNRAYSRGDVCPSGPLPLSAAATPKGVEVLMRYGYGMCSSDGQPVRTFEVAAADGVFVPAEAIEIKDNYLLISNMQIDKPKYVRYAWQPFTRANLVNGEGLPASTFQIEIEDGRGAEPGIENGVSAMYAGQIDGVDILAGGCNFPNNPLGADSRKVSYKGIYAIEPGKESVRIGSLPAPMAYGVAVSVPQGMVLATGVRADGPVGEAWLLTRDRDGNAALSALPSLPVAIDNAAACALGEEVYVIGGNCNGKPSRRAWRLALNGLADGWTELPEMPGNARVQPVVAAAPNNKGEACIWVFGGFAADGPNSTLELDGLCYNVKKNKWTAVGGPKDEAGEPLSVAGGCAAVVDDGAIAVAGGVNKDIFLNAIRNQAPDYLSHPISWYQFNPRLLAFNPKTQQWRIVVSDESIARAGAAMLPHGQEVVLYGGELKPRIRTAEAVTVTVE